MKLAEFDFTVPEELVAQRPLERREDSRMLVLHRRSGKIEHSRFLELAGFLLPTDTLVFNRSRVIKARLIGQRPSGGKVEIFLLRRLAGARFECLVRATAAAKAGLEVSIGEGLLHVRVLGPSPDSMAYEAELSAPDGRLDFWLDKFGRMPLPPYIRRSADGIDSSRYQTVYAEEAGSVAAPTAGLHFIPEILAKLEKKVAALRYLTLHVGLGTFQPIKTETIEEHRMHRELFALPEGLAESCRSARNDGRRIIAVGTTSVRALESAARGMRESTDLFLSPGADFRWVDALFTNFHQPKSSLIVMLAAFVGNKELLFEAYAQAVAEKYRFFSYGDCMLVI